MQEKLNDELVGQLIGQELSKSETEGMELFLRLSSQTMTEEEYERRMKTVRGYRVWWTSDASASLEQVKINSVNRLAEGLYEVSARCLLGIARAREYIPGQTPEINVATVRMKVTNSLEVKEFNFQWGEP